MSGDDREWLEADGLGGFASGTASGLRTRRYHALLLTAETDGTRFVLVNGVDVFLETIGGEWPLSTQAYAGGVRSPGGERWIESFTPDAEGYPWPRWVFALPDGTRLEQEVFALNGSPRVFLRWRLLSGCAAGARLRVRPFLSGRDYHDLAHENPAFAFEPVRRGDRLVWTPYEGVPTIELGSNGHYRHQPHWYRRFDYAGEAARGLDHEEDLASPGEIHFDLSEGEAVLMLARGDSGEHAALVASLAMDARTMELDRRGRAGAGLKRAADAYVIERGEGKTIIAGYPWFTDWGRDTFIALRGLCLATGRLDDARAILLRWADAVSGGMLPNRFPDRGAEPEYNSVDAALWYVVAVWEYLELAAGRLAPRPDERQRLADAVEAILDGHLAGTRYRIGVDADGLLAAGEPGVQLTWMDAKIGDWVVTPRTGKPVEIQALWLNALWIGQRLDTPSARRWKELSRRGRASFAHRFWNASTGALYDVIDVDHEPGRNDPTFRPNQILAVGGLPLQVLSGPRARAVVDAVEERLYTPLGLRTLAPSEAGYRPHYAGSMSERDSAYHQGTVWPWLLGPLVEAWLRVRGGTGEARREARARFLQPLLDHLEEAGLGHVSEVADGEAPHTPGGCPFQAWSLGELLRLDLVVCAQERRSAPLGGAARGHTGGAEAWPGKDLP